MASLLIKPGLPQKVVQLYTLFASLVPGTHLTLVSGVASFTFLRPELPIMGVLLVWGGWWTVGFGLGLHFLQTVSSPVWFPDW